jgi:hypothetical protein
MVMLYIRIELWPRGDKSRARVLHEGTICNEGGAAAATRGNYSVVLNDRGGRPRWRGFLMGFPRKRLGAWELLRQALNAVLGG